MIRRQGSPHESVALWGLVALGFLVVIARRRFVAIAPRDRAGRRSSASARSRSSPTVRTSSRSPAALLVLRAVLLGGLLFFSVAPHPGAAPAARDQRARCIA